jgi:hypothetical protein
MRGHTDAYVGMHTREGRDAAWEKVQYAYGDAGSGRRRVYWDSLIL